MTLISDTYALLSRAIPGRSSGVWFRRMRVIMYSLLYPHVSGVWLRALVQDPLLTGMALRNRRFLERPYHPAFQSGMTTRDRVALVCEHFRVAAAPFWSAVTRRVYLNGEAVTLAYHERYAIVLSNPTRCWREGLLTVAWRDEAACVDLAWATISFELHRETGLPGILVGGLQGPRGNGRELVREATRACHGLRPKAAVMEAVCMLCRIAQVRVLAAVTTRAHISRAGSSEFHADYDAFWREMGGVESEGRFVLPLRPYHRDISKVPSNRRAVFRRRQELIANLLAQFDTVLGMAGEGHVEVRAPAAQEADVPYHQVIEA
ncbi:VirK/YbjX family protein [Paraburkholderia acidiphila]|uniref:DUF535 domain-containing protein n=1 Tax=Paraburkholderia acidiphila TaxID=2571747 RepID=A0A7Z2J9Y7_9BURK|nr:DUF535 family protein [Paraburkholderia acidiphila]QGZ56871.1 DUF535 domain-containing protein [Paraburkholderia acidiphila]